MVKAAPIIEADLLQPFIGNQDSDSIVPRNEFPRSILVRIEAENVVDWNLITRIMLTVSTN